jgi:hypothetical protein
MPTCGSFKKRKLKRILKFSLRRSRFRPGFLLFWLGNGDKLRPRAIVRRATNLRQLIGGFFHFSERENKPEPENQYETRFDFANRWLYRSQRNQIHTPGSFFFIAHLGAVGIKSQQK